jgi:NADPH:quinone reductase-like Zn-dependent oxidoreductase
MIAAAVSGPESVRLIAPSRAVFVILGQAGEYVGWLGGFRDSTVPLRRRSRATCPGPRDLLVQVEAIAVNPVDYKIRQSADPGGELRVLGWDAAGTVAAVGGQAELFQAGDEVSPRRRPCR